MNASQTAPTAADRLRHAIDARSRAEAAEARALADFAAEHEWPVDAEIDLVGQRPVRVGADGTPVLDEYVALEVAALKAISVTAATWLIRDIVNLRFRHPRLWARTLAGDIALYRACQLAAEAARFELTAEQAHHVDDELAPHLTRLPWRRLLTYYRGLIADQVPGKLHELAQRARAERYVRKLSTDDPTVAYLSARVDTADALYFDAMIDHIADLLEARGDTDPKDLRRAKSIGILATPARATLLLAEAANTSGPTNQLGLLQRTVLMDQIDPTDLLGLRDPADSGSQLSRGGLHDSGATQAEMAQVWQAAAAALPTIRWTDPRLLPTCRIFVHVAEDTLMHGRGPARAENIGPIAATMLTLLVGHSRIQLTPVIRPYDTITVDSYEIPRRIRDQVNLRDTYEIFPYSSRSARSSQHDHTNPYRAGRAGQTRTDNLGALTTKTHRGKTHGHWRLKQPQPGLFWWKSPDGNQYRVGPRGTMRIPTDSPLEQAAASVIWRNDNRPNTAYEAGIDTLPDITVRASVPGGHARGHVDRPEVDQRPTVPTSRLRSSPRPVKMPRRRHVQLHRRLSP